MWNRESLSELQRRRQQAVEGGGNARVARQHAQQKLTARERIDLLFDAHTFVEVNAFMETRCTDFDLEARRVPGDGVVTGYGKVNGRLVFAASEDFTVIGGTLGEAHARRICGIMDMALSMRGPFVLINDGGGARIEEGIVALNGYGELFRRATQNSGIIPQIAAVMGPCAGGACYLPALCDFVFIVRHTGKMFITGPQVVKTVTREEISPEALGGADVHTQKSGVCHFAYEGDAQCLQGIRDLLAYLPQSADVAAPLCPGVPKDASASIERIVPDSQGKAYDVRHVIDAMVDENSFLESQAEFARNIVVGFGRIDGRTVGFVANQPTHMAGVLDIHASEKAARFVRTCDCFRIPVVALVDTPAFLPGSLQEHEGIIRHGAKLLYAFSEASVPKITLIMRKAFGGAYIAMNSKSLGADLVFAWPIATIAVMGAEGAVNILYGRALEAADNSEAQRAELIEQYEQKFMNPYAAAAHGYVDEVIHPEETRQRIAGALSMLQSKKPQAQYRRHGSMPL